MSENLENAIIKKRVFGNIAGVPNPISDWNETNERKTSFIKNKPDINAIVDEATSYTNTDPLINDIGGIKTTEHANGFNNVPINDLLTELLYPYTKPIISDFKLSPGAGTKEKGEPITLTSATVVVTKKSKNISRVDLCRDSDVLKSYEGEVTSKGTTITFSDINDRLEGTEDSVTYTIKVSEENGTENVVTSSAKYTFVNPYYYGVINKDDEINEKLITGLTKKIETSSSKVYTYTTPTKDDCAVIAYPSSYGNLSNIKDANGFTQTWSKYSITINGVGYYVYVSGPAAATNFKYTFSY